MEEGLLLQEDRAPACLCSLGLRATRPADPLRPGKDDVQWRRDGGASPWACSSRFWTFPAGEMTLPRVLTLKGAWISAAEG